jgi:hypothetical protein
MSGNYYFHRFPVELLHLLFDYFTAHELLHTFFHMSGYINEVLCAYSAYRLNFQSIQMANFDLVCRHICPDRVISLTLSDDNDTPGLSQLFLSRFRMEQFTRLRSLTLIQIGNDSLQLISSYLHRFNQLRSLSINTESIRFIQNQCKNSNLRHIKLEKCTDDELEIIWHRLPQLKSLDVCLNVNRSRLTLILPRFNHLIRLNLQIESKSKMNLRVISVSSISFVDYRTSMDEMEKFLKNIPDLKHLQLKTEGLRDLFDGDRWKTLTKTFHTFNFQFTAQFFPNENIFQSFCTPFWLEEKRWFVAYQDYVLFSIPHLAPNHIDISQQSYIRSTAPNDTFLYNHINKMVIKTVAIEHHQYFNHIETLELKYSASLKTIASIMNLSSIKHLSVFSLDDVLKFIPLEDSMPHLCQLTVENELTIDRIERVNRYRFEQIHRLEIGVNEKQSDRIIEKLSTIFPCIQYLIYKSPVPSKETAAYLINRFQYLTNVSFLVDIWSYRREDNFLLTPILLFSAGENLDKVDLCVEFMVRVSLIH